MDKTEFEQCFKDLTKTEKDVLKLMVVGKTDQEISSLRNTEDATTRKHIERICNKFGIETSSNSQSSPRRNQLLCLVIPFKAEIIENKTSTDVNDEDTKSEPNHKVEKTVNSVFVGREEAMADLNTRLQRGEKVVVIQAPGGVGKTTLAKQFIKTLKGRGYLTIEYQMAKEISTIASVESVVEEWLKRDFEEEPGREFGVTLMRLKRLIQTRKVAILIDNLEPALNSQGQFIEAHRGYMCLLQVLADSSAQSITLITTREPLCEGLAISSYALPTLTVEAWEEFFKTRDIEVDEKILQEMHKAYGGNALAMKVLCDPIERDGGMFAYWKSHKIEDNLLVETRVENLIKEQFNRLQEVYSDAYKLLYRLGCYRYQEVQAVPEKGLFCLLWDVPVRQHRKVIEALKSRHLVEWKNQEYWLHPVIREEAVSRLRESEDWEEANRKAAEFWTESVKTVETIDDAMTALEAYYHYVEIKDYEQAGGVIIKFRLNKWNKKHESLGVSFWRLGLLQQIIISIQNIINHVKDTYCLSQLNIIIGYAYNLIGYPKQAIQYHINSRNLAEQDLKTLNRNDHQSNLSFLRYPYSHVVMSFGNIGCGYIDLWEFEEAIINFQKCRKLSDKPGIHRYKVEAWCLLAYVYSCLNLPEKASDFAQKASEQLEITKWSSWSHGYALLFLGLTYNNLKELEKALEMHNQAIAFAEESHYKQVKAKALTGLAELYRIQEDFENAFKYHRESIELLDNIGAKCDLAEAYYQVGLTYQQVGERQKSEESFLEAIRRFESMEAPRQVEKVQKAMGNG
jgi:tetratricopeptide (TPR) repeat protein